MFFLVSANMCWDNFSKPVNDFEQARELWHEAKFGSSERRHGFQEMVRTANTAEDIGVVLFVGYDQLDQKKREKLSAKMLDALKAEEVRNGFPEPMTGNATGPLLNAKPRSQVYMQALDFISRPVYTADDYFWLEQFLLNYGQNLKKLKPYREALYPYSDEEYSLILEDVQKITAKRMEAH